MASVRLADCFSKNLKFWRILGIYPWKINWKLNAFFSIISLFVFMFLYDFLSTLTFFFLPKDLNLLIEEMITYLTLLSVASKAVTYLIRKDKLKDILTFLDSDKFQPKTEKEIQIITEAKKFNKKFWNIIASVSYFSNIMHVFAPLFIHWLMSTPIEFPVSRYTFLSEDSRTKYSYYIYIYQSIGIHINMLYNINIDTFLLGLMVIVTAQLDILDEKLKNITAIKCEDYDENTRSDIDIMCIRKLNECIVQYGKISKFCQLIEEVFGASIFVQFSMSSSIICVCLFRMTMPAPVQYYLFLGSYLSIMIMQIMIPCFFGTQIMEKSSRLSNAVYVCDWTPRSRRFKSSMRLFVERAHRPHSITGWKLFPLSLVTFTSIINRAYSFFTLLQQVQSNEA